MHIDPFALLLAVIPLIGYLLLLGGAGVLGKPIVTTGARDIAALALAIIGFLAVGPAQLFFPRAAAMGLGAGVWIALFVFYSLCVTLVALTSTPRLVVYGRRRDEMLMPVQKAALQMDPGATLGQSTSVVSMPTVGVSLHVTGQAGIDYTRITALQPNLPPHFWSELLGHLRCAVGELPPPVPRRGVVMLVAATILSLTVLQYCLGNGALIVEGFREWLYQ